MSARSHSNGNRRRSSLYCNRWIQKKAKADEGRNSSPNINEKYEHFAGVIAGVIIVLMGIYLFSFIKSIMILPVILLGIIVIIKKGKLFGSKVKKEEEGKRLRTEGRCIYATLEEVMDSWSYEKTHINGIKLKCSYVDEGTGKEYTFISDTEYQIPSYAFNVGDPVKVYVKWNDFSEYYVDVRNSVTRKIVDCT